MRDLPTPFIITLVGVAILIPLLAIGVSKEADQFRDKCRALNGEVISTRTNWYCIKASVLLEKK